MQGKTPDVTKMNEAAAVPDPGMSMSEGPDLQKQSQVDSPP